MVLPAPIGHLGRGILMGMAGLFPSISAGTIALILGVHARLVVAIAGVDHRVPRDLWRAARGNAIARAALGRLDLVFLIPIVLGMGIAIFGGVAGVDWLLERQPQMLMALFVGLMLAGARVPWKHIPEQAPRHVAWLALGVAIAGGLAFLPPLVSIQGGWGYALAGFIAWAFMLLPGVSGSSIMVVLGLYEPLIAAAKGFLIGPLLAFAAGGLAGIVLCSRFLSWLLRKHPGAAFATLTGLIVGSLVRVWPWRTETGFAGGWPTVPVLGPGTFGLLVAAAFGAMIVMALERVGPTIGEERPATPDAKP